MKTLLPALICLPTLSACEPLSLYDREGESISRMQTETTARQMLVLKDVIVANQVRQNPPVYWPDRTYCDGSGR